MKEILQDVVLLNYELKIKKSEFVGSAEITLTDLDTMFSESDYLPINNHLHEQRVAQSIKLLMNKLASR